MGTNRKESKRPNDFTCLTFDDGFNSQSWMEANPAVLGLTPDSRARTATILSGRHAMVKTGQVAPATFVLCYCNECEHNNNALYIRDRLQFKQLDLSVPTPEFRRDVFRFLSFVQKHSSWSLFVPNIKVPKPEELFSLSRDGLTNP